MLVRLRTHDSQYIGIQSGRSIPTAGEMRQKTDKAIAKGSLCMAIIAQFAALAAIRRNVRFTALKWFDFFQVLQRFGKF